MNKTAIGIASEGSRLIEVAILRVLFEARQDGGRCGVGAAAISKATMIYREKKEGHCMNDAIVTGTLFKLLDDGKTERMKQRNGRGGWGLTDDYYEAMLSGDMKPGELHKNFGLDNEQD